MFAKYDKNKADAVGTFNKYQGDDTWRFLVRRLQVPQCGNFHVNNITGSRPLAVFLLKCVGVRHTKIAKRPRPLQRTVSSLLVSPWCLESVNHFTQSKFRILRLFYTFTFLISVLTSKVHNMLSGKLRFPLSRMSGNVVVSRSSCMHLCSQGPHLWPFISSQVKGLRDDDARRQTQRQLRSRVLDVTGSYDILTWKTYQWRTYVTYFYCGSFGHAYSLRWTFLINLNITIF